MSVGLVCASHSPLLDQGGASPEDEAEVQGAYARLGAWVRDFAPDLIVQFWPDHFNGFFYDVMPSFCIGTEAHAIGDWNTREGALRVDADTAMALGEAIRAADIDIALSHSMRVDHGCVQMWDLMLNGTSLPPIVPVFINCAAPPLPSFRRVRLLGEVVGRFFAGSGKRVLFAGSGGLSHDPPIPNLETVPPERRQILIDNRNPGPEAVAARVERVREAGRLAAIGEGPALPPDPAWDEAFLTAMSEGDLGAYDDIGDAELTKTAGCGGHEVRTWIAAFAALKAGGDYQTTVECYRCVPAYLTGMGFVRAETRH